MRTMNGDSTELPTLTTADGLAIHYLNKPETEFVYKEIFEERVYFRHGITLGETDCVFDVGANIGLFSMFIKENFRKSRVFAFEPAPKVFNILQTNVARYGGDVVCCPWGISATARQAVFTYYPGYSILSGFHAREGQDMQTLKVGILNQWRERFPERDDMDEQLLEAMAQEALTGKAEYLCKMRTLSEIFHEAHVEEIGLLKVDAEGSELDVLLGIADGDWGKIRQVAMEVHDPEGTVAPLIGAMLRDRKFVFVFEEEKRLQGSGILNCYARRS